MAKADTAFQGASVVNRLKLAKLEGMVSKHRDSLYRAGRFTIAGSRSRTGSIPRSAGFRISSEAPRGLTIGLPSRTNVCPRRKRTCGPQTDAPGLTQSLLALLIKNSPSRSPGDFMYGGG